MRLLPNPEALEAAAEFMDKVVDSTKGK
jgi:hypothetical protein